MADPSAISGQVGCDAFRFGGPQTFAGEPAQIVAEREQGLDLFPLGFLNQPGWIIEEPTDFPPEQVQRAVDLPTKVGQDRLQGDLMGIGFQIHHEATVLEFVNLSSKIEGQAASFGRARSSVDLDQQETTI